MGVSSRYPNTSVKPKFFQPTLLPPPLYSGEMSHHMHDSGESPDVSVCHTISYMTSPSVCQLHDSSVCQPNHESTWKSFYPSVCLSSVLSVQPSAKFTAHNYCWIKFPESPFHGEIPCHLYFIRFVCQSIRQSINHTVTIS